MPSLFWIIVIVLVVLFAAARALRTSAERAARLSMWARRARSARIERSAGSSRPSGSTRRSNRARKARCAGPTIVSALCRDHAVSPPILPQLTRSSLTHRT